MRVEHIVAAVAEEDVVARAALQNVVAAATLQQVVPVPARDGHPHRASVGFPQVPPKL